MPEMPLFRTVFVSHAHATAARVTLATLAALCGLLIGTAAPAHAAASTLPGSCGASAGTGRFDPASVPVSATGARISLNTASAVAGTQIIVYGTGWPGGVPITIDVEHFVETGGFVTAFHGLAEATATSTGAFTAPMFVLPRGMCDILPQAGTTAEIVAHTSDEGIQAAAALSIVQTPTIEVVLPSLTLPPGATSIPVSGSAWVPGISVSLVAAGFPPDCQGVTANDLVICLTSLSGAQPVIAVAAADGTFRSDVPIPPSVQPGTLMTIRAAVSVPPYGELVLRSDWEAQRPPTVAPTLTLDHATGPAGATVVVRGDHWPASQRVVVSYCRSEAMSWSQSALGPQCNQGAQGLVVTGYAEELGEVDTDASGHFALQVVLPANARPGAIAFEVRLASQALEADVYVQTAAFTITVTTAASPASAGLGWSFAVGSAAVLAVLSLTGILLWRRRRLRLHVARSIR